MNNAILQITLLSLWVGRRLARLTTDRSDLFSIGTAHAGHSLGTVAPQHHTLVATGAVRRAARDAVQRRRAEIGGFLVNKKKR